ncbi:MAG: DivIVA domain-containing protein [Eubacteriales bacterium]
MLAPHELKNKTFSKVMRGYNPAEVDDYIEFLVDTYTTLYRENSELERKLKIVVTNLDEIKDEEEAIRSTLLKSQKLGEKIIRDANEKAEVITGSIKDRCDLIISEFREQLGDEKQEMWLLRTKILDFKKNVYDLYRQHIEDLQSISVNELEDIVLPNETDIINKIFSDVKTALKDEVSLDEQRREDADLNAVPELASIPEKREISSEEYIKELTKKQNNPGLTGEEQTKADSGEIPDISDTEDIPESQRRGATQEPSDEEISEDYDEIEDNDIDSEGEDGEV